MSAPMSESEKHLCAVKAAMVYLWQQEALPAEEKSAAAHAIQALLAGSALTGNASPHREVEAVRRALLSWSLAGEASYEPFTGRMDLSVKEWLTHLQKELLSAAVCVETLKGRL